MMFEVFMSVFQLHGQLLTKKTVSFRVFFSVVKDWVHAAQITCVMTDGGKLMLISAHMSNTFKLTDQAMKNAIEDQGISRSKSFIM